MCHAKGLIWWSHNALCLKLNKALRTQTNLSAGKNSLLVLVSPGDLLIIIKKDWWLPFSSGKDWLISYAWLYVEYECVCVCVFLTGWLCVAEQQVHVWAQEGVGGGGRGGARGGRAWGHGQSFTAQSLEVHFAGQLCREHTFTDTRRAALSFHPGYCTSPNQ